MKGFLKTFVLQQHLFNPRCSGLAIRSVRIIASTVCGCAGAGQNAQGAISLADVFSLRDGKASTLTLTDSEQSTLVYQHVHT